MFITREDALAKLNHPDNPFSPSRIHDGEAGPDWGRVVEIIDVSDAGQTTGVGDTNDGDGSPSTTPVPCDVGSDADEPSSAEIRDILKQTDPAFSRDRSHNLKGHIEVQAAIGQTAIITGRQTAGALYDRSYAQTTAYENGHGHHKSLYGADKGPAKPELVERLDSFKEKLAVAAGRVLESSLEALDETKIGKLKLATSISRVAKDMAVIMDKVSRNGVEDNSVHFHIYRPDMRSVNAYDTVKINGGTSVSSLPDTIIESKSVEGG